MAAEERRLDDRARLVGAIVVYGIVLTGSLLLLKGDLVSPWRTVIALLPVVPMVGVVWVVLSRIRSLDEYWQQIHLTALPVAFLGSLLFAFTWGFLQNAGVAPLDGFVMFAVMVGLYVVGIWVARRRLS